MTAPTIPDALAEVIAAIEEAYPYAEPRRKGELMRDELRRLGWHVGLPGSCRPTGQTVAGGRGGVAAEARS